MDKKTARAQALVNLQNLTDEQRARAMQLLVKQVTQLTAWQKAKTVALTLGQGAEIPTDLLVQTALLQGKVVTLPRVLPKRQMEFVGINQATNYHRHQFGMLEPVDGPLVEAAEIDFVLVPGLAYTKAGDRLGFGGGYYDRWLPQTKATKVAVTLAANYQVQAHWPKEATDVQVDQILVIDERNLS